MLHLRYSVISLFMMIVSWSYAEAKINTDSIATIHNERVITTRSLVITKKEKYEICKATIPYELTYTHSISKPNSKKVLYFQKETRFGVSDNKQKIMNAKLLWPFAEVIARRYSFVTPEMILAFALTETGGCENIFNQNKDGGHGISHAQSSTAKMYGLTIACKDQLKDSGCCETIGYLIKKYRNNPEVLYKRDNLLSILHNLDLIARMIGYEIAGYHNGRLKHSNALNIFEYVVGSLGPNQMVGTYRKFNRNHIGKYMKNFALLHNSVLSQEVEEQFNIKNNNIVCFDEYIREWHNFYTTNYKLNDYADLPPIVIEGDNANNLLCSLEKKRLAICK